MVEHLLLQQPYHNGLSGAADRPSTVYASNEAVYWHAVTVRRTVGDCYIQSYVHHARRSDRPAAERASTVGVVSKREQPWSGEPTRLIDGVVQYFDGGVMIWLPRPDDVPTIVTVMRATTTTWEETDDR